MSQNVVDIIKAAAPASVQALKTRLLASMDFADGVTGETMPRWRDAIEHLDTEPERILNCNTILQGVVAEALNPNILADRL